MLSSDKNTIDLMYFISYICTIYNNYICISNVWIMTDRSIMIQGPSNTDLRTNTLRILARIVAKAILQKSIKLSSECDVMFVIGTSAVVQPAATLPFESSEAGAKIV